MMAVVRPSDLAVSLWYRCARRRTGVKIGGWYRP